MRLLLSKGFAALSKPRCGSTSLRRALDPFVDPAAGDLAVDRAGQKPPYHPHITGPALRALSGHPDLDMIITVRHPVDMLWSYYKFFQPDENGRYSFHPLWTGAPGRSFEEWVQTGRIGKDPEWLRLAPKHITTSDLSPLSLEAHAFDHSGQPVARIFQVEEPAKLEDWLSNRLGAPVSLPKVNSTDGTKPAPLGETALARVRRMFCWESDYYGI